MRHPGPRRIGLLGGSFNPAHDGHAHISRWALHKLDLHEVWWLVSPGNPLKDPAGLAPYADRVAHARHVAKRLPHVQVTDIEDRLGTTYTLDTLAALKVAFPAARFVWLMGADNLGSFDRWQGWRDIFHTVPIAVFDRPTYSYRALAGRAARQFAKARLPGDKARALADKRPPAWVFLKVPLNPRSATRLRARGRWTTADRL